MKLRAVMASAVALIMLVLAACGSSSGTSGSGGMGTMPGMGNGSRGTPGSASGSSANTVNVTLSDFKIAASQTTFKVGVPYHFVVTNAQQSTTNHELMTRACPQISATGVTY
jgi:hypothetical protein